MAYAIARVEKVKTLTGLTKLGQHHTRERPTPNADPSRSIRILAGSGNPAADVKAILPEKRRSNAVLAVEHLLTASPEYFRPDAPDKAGTWDEARMESWVKLASQFLQERYGDRLASAVLHLDEATPHIQALVVPLRDDGKLDAASLFGPQQLVKLQDDYAAAMKPLGLQRGIEGSKAKHESIRSFYGRVNSPVPEIPEVKTPRPQPLPPPRLVERIPFTQAKADREEAEEKARQQAQKRARELQTRSKAIEVSLEALSAKAAVSEARVKANASRAKVVEKMRAESARVRDVPLDQVLERLGAKRDTADAKNWKTPAGRITVTGSKFFNHDLNQGGGGAIDLVMQQIGCDAKQAIAWLGADFGREAAIGAAMTTAKEAAERVVTSPAPSPVPAPSQKPEHVATVRRYLTEARKIPAKLVDWAMEKGKVFAASWTTAKGATFVNAAFQLDTGGVELRGTQGTYHGVRGKKGAFVIQTAPGASKAVFVESAIDALSYAALHDGEAVRIISTTGSSRDKLEEMVKREVDAGRKLVAAFDRDTAGAKLAEVVIAAGGVREKPPTAVKDWNELLQHQFRAEQIRREQAARPAQDLSLKREGPYLAR